jgi:hypothetical protein
MKKTMLLLAAFVLLITTAVPGFADGNPRPYCDKNGCQMPPSN